MAASSPSSAFKCPQQRLHNFIIPGELKWSVTSVNHNRVRKSAASNSSYRSSTSRSDGNNNNVNNHVALHGPKIGNSAMASPNGIKKRKEKPEKKLRLLNSPVDNFVKKNKFVIRLKTLTSSTVSDQTKSSTDQTKSSKSADAGTAASAAADVADQAADAAAGDYTSVVDGAAVVADAVAGDHTSVVNGAAMAAGAAAGDRTSVVDSVADATAGDHTSVVDTVAVVAEEEVLIKSWDFRPRRAVSKSKPPVNGNGGELRNGGADAQETKTQQQNRPVLAKAGEKKGKPKNQVIVPDMSIPLSKEEIEEDIFALTGSKPSRKPNKRPKNVQKQIDCLFPGTWLPKVTPDDYKVTESKWKG